MFKKLHKLRNDAIDNKLTMELAVYNSILKSVDELNVYKHRQKFNADESYQMTQDCILTEAEIATIINQDIKRRYASMFMYKNAGHNDRAAEEEKYIKVVEYIIKVGDAK